MSEFLFLIRGGEAPASPEQMQMRMERWLTWMQNLDAKGHIKDRGNPLEDRGEVVSAEKKTVKDGLYAEANNDNVGGYMLIEANNLPQAAEIARGCPILEVGGSVDVRPIQKRDQ